MKRRMTYTTSKRLQKDVSKETDLQKTFVGFGFGPIQSGLFLFEAYQTGNFGRYAVAEVDQMLVDAVRANKGSYVVNVAHRDGIEHFPLKGIELYNPAVKKDREELVKALSSSDEVATALPAVRFYDMGDSSVVKLIAEGLALRKEKLPTIIYAAENHNQAAEILGETLHKYAGSDSNLSVQALNTVIGKMSGVISDPETIEAMGLQTITPDLPRAILVEEFNRILISRVTLPDYRRGITVFAEKDDLLPFEEAKLYGHNAIHALIAYLADLRGLQTVADAAAHPDIMRIAHDAFLKESGTTLIRRHKDLNDELFTPDGYAEYAVDLLDRMVNPYLNDLVERVGRDHLRKLGYEDRLYGTMHLALQYDVEPVKLGMGAAAGVVCLLRRRSVLQHAEQLPLPGSEKELTRENLEQILRAIWKEKSDRFAGRLVELTWQGLRQLREDGWI
jgi:mannitol-1-phosphate 5-dehydrogenase